MYFVVTPNNEPEQVRNEELAAVCAMTASGFIYFEADLCAQDDEKETAVGVPQHLLGEVPDITFSSGAEAEEVLNSLRKYIGYYNIATVADYRQRSGLQVCHDDFTRGWTHLEEARVIYSRGKFVLDLPLVERL